MGTRNFWSPNKHQLRFLSNPVKRSFIEKRFIYPNGSTLTFGNSNEEPYQGITFDYIIFEDEPMNATEYVQNAIKTDLDDKQYNAAAYRAFTQIELLHAALGIATESGEFVDSLKKHILYGKEIDPVNLEEELGDLLWYIAIACHEPGVPLESIFEVNIAKLKARYGDKFTEAAALNRDLDKERKILEGDK